MHDDEVLDLFQRCSNRGRWGQDDQLGTLNYITDAKRRQAAHLVRRGRTVTLGRDLATRTDQADPDAVLHLMLSDPHLPMAAEGYLGMRIHGLGTHLDALAHVQWEGTCYNGRAASEVIDRDGLAFASIHAQRDGIFTRGVLLDVARARDVRWVEPADMVTVEDLEAAEEWANVRVERGDALFVRVGLDVLQSATGFRDVSERAGLDARCVEWFHRREIAVFGGDCVEKIPYPSARFPLPLHQIGLASMGLVLLDWPEVEELGTVCEELGTWEFLATVAPLPLPRGTGSAVNPLCVF
ncbi:cyclase family protein [Streptomyces macrosporus]|uniref:Cyclase family protein n=1 Tax=Streptomyces macrosporus TaxID=44032 RepID=A0ABP5XI65_9ACTN